MNGMDRCRHARIWQHDIANAIFIKTDHPADLRRLPTDSWFRVRYDDSPVAPVSGSSVAADGGQFAAIKFAETGARQA
jgi:hypothetical protein